MIRRLLNSDLGNVSKLFEFKKSQEELRWLFRSEENKNSFNAFVAIDENENLVGVIAYLNCNYIQGEKEIQGVIPISWKVSENYKGLAGVMLFKKVFNNSDFGLAISGSNVARDLYKLFHFEFYDNVHVYYKLLITNNLYSVVKKKSFLKTIGFLGYLTPSLFQKPKTFHADANLKIEEYESNSYRNLQEFDNVFKKKVSKEYVDWLLDCPIGNSYGYIITKNNIFLGIYVVIVIKKGKGFIGRIIHMPFLGIDEKNWNGVLNHAYNVFKSKKCSLISTVAYNDNYRRSLSNSKFVNVEKYKIPIYLKDKNNNLNNFNLNNWMFQFSEGDNFYRGI